jgi:hypothetical protein
MAAFVWEPSLVKINAIQAATEASCLILSVDETISKWQPTYKNHLAYTNEMNREPGIPGSPSPWPTTPPWCRPKGDARQRKRYAQKVNKFCQQGTTILKAKHHVKLNEEHDCHFVAWHVQNRRSLAKPFFQRNDCFLTCDATRLDHENLGRKCD